MPTQIQVRRGTTAQNNAFTGVVGEVTADTQVHTLRIHDGSQVGGYELALANLSNVTFGAGVATFLATPSSANLAAAVTNETGSGALVFATSPTLVTPALGTPASGVMTNVTGTASGLTAGNVTTNANLTGGVTSVGNAATVVTNANLTGGVTSVGNAATVVTNANLTGHVTSVGNAAVLGTFSSAQLSAALSDETGTGVSVFGTSPSITTSLTTGSASFDLVNTTATTVNFAKAATALSIGASSGTTTINNALTVTGNLTVSGTTTTVDSTTVNIQNAFVFEGATADAYETTLTVVDPTADNTITLPNVTGTVITTGDTGTVTSTMILDGTILNADINASAAIVDTKLATISTALKVSNSATTATNANTASAIVARDASGNFSAGTITATLTGSASTATALATPRAINGTNFDGTAAITVTADATTLTGATLASNVLASSLTSVGTLAALTVTAPITGSVTGASGSTTGNAATATALATPRAINGTNFDGTAAITVTAAMAVIANVQAADVTVSGITRTGTAGENLAFGDICYMKSDGNLWKADANAASLFPAKAMATATITATNSGTFLMVGQARNDAWNWTIGGTVYLSTTAGSMTQTAPTATDDCVQVLGVAFPNADTVYFNPSPDYITLV